MNSTKDFLRTLISLPGLSGYEDPVRAAIADAWRTLVDELHTSPVGSLHGLKRGRSAAPRPSILLMAHMDAVGLMVTRIVNGFLRITAMGGVDPRILPGQRVIVHGRRPLPAVIVQPPLSLLPPDTISDAPVAMEYLFADTGLLPDDVSALVRVGDLVSFAQEPLELANELIAGHSLDNRVSVAALTICLEELRGKEHAWDVWSVASVQEEETLAGARTSPFSIRPDLVIAIDATWARGPGSPSDYRTFPLGKGLTLGWGAEIHPGLHRSFKELADALEIPYFIELMPTRSGTDAMGMLVTAEGVSSMVVSIPIRYMHTPVEVVSMEDIQRCGHLLAEFVARLQTDYLQTLNWDDAA